MMFVIQGQIRQKDGKSAVGLTVRAVNREGGTGETTLGEALTDQGGLYKITYEEELFKLLSKGRNGLDMILTISDPVHNMHQESSAVRIAQAVETVNSEVSWLPWKAPEPQPSPFRVGGQVRWFDGRPAANFTVRAFDKDLRSEEELGEAVTDKVGKYQIFYSAAQFRRAEKASADLIVRVLDKRASVLAESPIIFNAQPVETIDIVFTPDVAGPSEYEQVAAEIEPVISGHDPATLTAQDISFLTGETGVDPLHLAFFVQSHRLKKETSLAPEAFYGLFRQGLPTDLPTLLAQSQQLQRRSLEKSLREQIIPANFRERLDEIIKTLKQLIARQDGTRRATLGALMETARLGAEQQREFLRLHLEHVGTNEQFWTGLRQNPQFASHVRALQFTLQAATLTKNHLPLVGKLQELRQSGQLSSLRDLAKLDAKDWHGIITKSEPGRGAVGVPPGTPGETDQEKANNYSLTMTRMLEEAFTTTAFASRIEKDRNAPGRADLLQFFANDQEFEFGSVPVEFYLSQNSAVLRGVADPAALREQLTSVERLTRLTPHYAEMRVLLDEKLDSAQAITNMGQNAFAGKYGAVLGGEARARVLYENANQVSAVALSLFANYGSVFNAISMQVLRPGSAPTGGVANLRTLFGSVDLCQCEECRSVYSPAAYLVDMLAFLRKRPSRLTDARGGRLSVKDMLFRRRPDIGELELTCENTNTPVPYVDLGNEILENEVAGTRAVPDRNRQTHGSPQELSANPEYINRPAYDKLRIEVYPWNLPFDLTLEEARIYLEHLGVQRWELMREFQIPIFVSTPPDPLAAVELKIAQEQLGLSSKEWEILTGTASEDIALFWGYRPDATNSWIDDLRKVQTFLQRSGLSYQDLSGLCKTKFINPDQHLNIVPDSPANANLCNPEHLLIDGLRANDLDRIHRFVRLWRKSGWTMLELDKVFTAFNPVALPQFLVQFSHVERLRTKLDVPVVTMLSWYAPLDTAQYNAEETPKPKSLYEELFQNPAVIKLQRDDPDPFKLRTTAPIEVEAAGTLGTDNIIAALLGALGISKPELSLLLEGAADPTLAGRGPVVRDQRLTLENLSRLYRNASLARALKLSIEDFLRFRDLTNINPFVNDSARPTATDTRNTLSFVDALDKVRASGFSIPELDYLLKHRIKSSSAILPTEETIGLVLDEIRKGLKKIAVDTTIAPDPTGDLTRKKLALLKWDRELAEQVIATLSNNAIYETPPLAVSPVPFSLTFPADDLNGLRQKFSYNETTRQLRFVGALTPAIRDQLLALSTAADYPNAIDTLFQMPRTFVREKLRVFETPSFSAFLNALPTGMAFPPPSLRNRISYDTQARELRLVGVLTGPEKTSLLALSTDEAYRRAIESLFEASNDAPDTNRTFIDAADVEPMFATSTTIEERFQLVLARLMPYLRDSASRNLVEQKLGAALQLEAKTVHKLVTRWVLSPVAPAQKVLDEFLRPSFIESTVKLNSADFAAQFKSFTRLHKSSLLITKFGVTTDQVSLLFEDGPGIGGLDVNALPLEPASAANDLFAGWELLLDLFQLATKLEGGAVALSGVFAAARDATVDDATVIRKIGAALKLSEASREALLSRPGFSVSYTGAEVRALRRLRDTLMLMKRLGLITGIMKRLGVEASQCLAWSGPERDLDARNIRQAVKARYDDEQWASIARPLRDLLREKQRAALVAYVLTHPDPSKGQRWKEVSELYDYFLLDVEMSPCQSTSRIKQAISSVQLFVQRCLMNLESDDVVASAQVDERWREWKWMKNYRVWEANRKVFLYPENWIEPELRDDKTPFFKELENEILQQDITSATAEDALLSYMEKLDGVARLEICGIYHQLERDGDGQAAVDDLHVLARSFSSPHVYYYRHRIDSAYWTPWEKVELDIEGDHLIPVVWNRRLCLIWPIFVEKTERTQVTVPPAGQTMPEPPHFWKIQLAYSELKNGKWLAKKISEQSVETDGLYPPETFSFEAAFEDGDLIVTGNYTYQHVRNERLRFPMVFSFRFTGCNGKVEVRSNPLWRTDWLPLLPGTHTEFTSFVEDSASEHNLTLAAPDSVDGSNFVPTLNSTPGTFRVYVNRLQNFGSEAPLFFADEKRTFFIHAEDVQIPVRDWAVDDQISATMVGYVIGHYYRPARLTVPPPDPKRINSSDPILFQLSYPIETQAAQNQPQRTPFNSVANIGATAVFNQGGAGNQGLQLDAVNAAVGGVLSPVSAIPENSLLAAYDIVRQYRFHTFYHPFVCLFIRQLNRDGIDGLLQRPLQVAPQNFTNVSPAFDFGRTYDPQPVVAESYPNENVDFSRGGAYSQYNWELFVHVPLTIADRLSKNQRFEEAQKWFHYIFDPTDTSSEAQPQKYWRAKPFFETSSEDYQNQQIQKLLTLLSSGRPDPDLTNQVKQWRKNPFNPHLIARLRTVAYQKTVVMKYIDNLIAWGDQLFRRDTMESINEATQLYILAKEILGSRPDAIPPRQQPAPETYNTLEDKLDDFSNALVRSESLVPVSPGRGVVSRGETPPLTLQAQFYFCIPRNDKLLSYWDTVADRLFKIRHCMNVQGVVRQLPLFEPPIDPALLVRAAAAGVDISSALSDSSAALPHYRFNIMAQKAGELCSDLKALGSALLSALEKRDAEALALLRLTHEFKVLTAVRQVKQQQVEEAKQTLTGLHRSREMAQIRYDYYANIQFMNQSELAHLSMGRLSLLMQSVSAGMDFIANILHLIPNIKVGVPTSMGATFGGHNLGEALKAYAGYLGANASMLNASGSLAATLGGYQRRFDDWKLQERLASKEGEQLDRQIAASGIRLAIAEKDLQSHDLQIQNAKEVADYMYSKFTRYELYEWMVAQISGIYFQSYQLAYDIAKRAERAYRFELGIHNSSFIQFGYWDSLKKGLLAGERLYHDLKRMETAYVDQNAREFELTRHISLLMLDPVALFQLKRNGQCFVELPEALFDQDYPGHYLRRIKSVGLTIPCVTGPYTTVNCTLTLVRNSLRMNTDTSGGYQRLPGSADPRFLDSVGAIQSIATSSGQNDSGLFELNFRDERFLPFECAGAISQWRIELPEENNRFDLSTITDVVLHLRYTARDGGEPLKRAAAGERRTDTRPTARLFSAKQEMPTEWHQFLHPRESDTTQTLGINLSQVHFPFIPAHKRMQITKIALFLGLKEPGADAGTAMEATLQPSSSATQTLRPHATARGMLYAEFPVSIPVATEPAPITLRLNRSAIPTALHAPVPPGSTAAPSLNADAIEDLGILVYYTISERR